MIMKITLLVMLHLALTEAHAQFSRERKVLLFGGAAQTQTINKQVAVLKKDSLGIEDRDITITIVKEGSPTYTRYNVPAGSFALVLIGKDGGEKHRSDKVMSTEELFAIIDAMPMRRSEMKRNGKSNNP